MALRGIPLVVVVPRTPVDDAGRLVAAVPRDAAVGIELPRDEDVVPNIDTVFRQRDTR